MKIKPREMALMLLPCVGLLAFGAVWSGRRGAEAKPALLKVQVVPDPPSTYEGGAFVGVFVVTSSSPEPPRRLYINCRIEGELNKRQRVFYATGGFDPYVCWSKTSGLGTRDGNVAMRQVFRMSYIPKGATNLTYHVEAVSLAGAWAAPQEVTRAELQQARLSPRLLASDSDSRPLFVPAGVIGHKME